MTIAQMIGDREVDQADVLELRTILFASDGSPESATARLAAVDLARRSGAALHVVTAYHSGLPAAFLPETFSDATHPWDTATSLLEAEREAIAMQGVPVAGAYIAVGADFETVTEIASQTDAGLMIVGSHKLGAVARLLLGRPTAAPSSTVCRPVLVVRGGEAAWPPARVIVGFDHSPESMRAASVAAAIAAKYDGNEVVLLRAVPRSNAVEAAQMTFGDLLETERAHMERHAEVLSSRSGCRVTAAVVVDDPARALLGAAAAGSGRVLLALGTRGLGRVKRFMLGSVSHRVLHHGSTSVLIVPGSATWNEGEHDAE